MQFRFTEKHLKLKFSLKELLLIILRGGNFLLDRKSCYEFSVVLQSVIQRAIRKYGDGKEHGVLEDKDPVDNPLK
tara:strand:+ start:1117 stop:1341 length:225 start_codon:yes stop_codon:yes gene_type:complete